MIGGRDWDEHNKSLAQLLQRLEDHNLTLRCEKCEFGKASIYFHGHLFTQEGLKPSPTKIQAVQNCAPPASKEELVSFLQIVAYLSRYISNFSSHHLRQKPSRTRRRTASEDWKRIPTCTLCEADLNWHREEVLSNQERGNSSRIYYNQAPDVPAWHTKVQVSHRPRATASTDEQSNNNFHRWLKDSPW